MKETRIPCSLPSGNCPLEIKIKEDLDTLDNIITNRGRTPKMETKKNKRISMEELCENCPYKTKR